MLTGIVLFAITLIFTFVASIQSYIVIPAEVLCGVAVVQGIFSIAAPSTRFGHWKDNRYKEKLEWDAFSRFLSDMAIIQKHAPADLSMWGEWLVYGTALGVGDKVEWAMKALNIRVAETGVSLGIMGMNAAFVPLMHFSPRVMEAQGVWWRRCRGDMSFLPYKFQKRVIMNQLSFSDVWH